MTESDDPLAVFMGEEPDQINASEGVVGDIEDEDVADIPVGDTTSQPDNTSNGQASGNDQRNNTTVYLHFLRPKGRLLLFKIEDALDISKFRITIGDKGDDDSQMQFINAYVDAFSFASWLNTMRYGSAKALSGGDEEGLTFSQFGGSMNQDGNAISRMIAVKPATDKEDNILRGKYTFSIRHSEGKRSNQGAIIPVSDGQVYGSKNFTLSGANLAEIGLRAELALQDYVHRQGFASLTS